MFKKILVPVDGSEGSWKCLETARAMAEKFAAKVYVITVVQQLVGASILAAPADTTILRETAMENSKKVLEMAKEKINYADVEFLIDTGRPSKVIVNTAKEKECDLVIIGNRGLSGFAEFFLGSVSSEVAQLSTVPVLIVK